MQVEGDHRPLARGMTRRALNGTVHRRQMPPSRWRTPVGCGRQGPLIGKQVLRKCCRSRDGTFRQSHNGGGPIRHNPGMTTSGFMSR